MSFPRIVFMGTPDFAVASLDALVKAGFEVGAVITAPDRPAGRGLKMNMSAVKQYALQQRLPVLQPLKLKDTGFIEELKALKADLQVVVAFRMLPEIVWNMPQMGTVNVHASLLPKYRGAAPINWAIINGETETGVTTFKLTHQIDTGNILLQEAVQVKDTDTAGDLHDLLKEKGAALLIRTVHGLIDGSVTEKPQAAMVTDTALLDSTHAPKIFTETCRIHWNDRAGTIYNLIRGLSPFPGAFTDLKGRLFKIYRAEAKNEAHSLERGAVESDYQSYLRFAAADGFVYALEVQWEGKKRMEIREFLKGYR